MKFFKILSNYIYYISINKQCNKIIKQIKKSNNIVHITDFFNWSNDNLIKYIDHSKNQTSITFENNKKIIVDFIYS